MKWLPTVDCRIENSCKQIAKKPVKIYEYGSVLSFFDRQNMKFNH